jgi:hypothetical protein
MFGLFKKHLKPEELGAGIVQYAHEFLAADANRSLGLMYDDWDGSKGWAKFLESKGMPRAMLQLHYRLFTHCSVQAASSQFSRNIGRAITQGAVVSFAGNVTGYNFESTYNSLEHIYCGQHRFDGRIERLSNGGLQMPGFHMPNIAVLNAKFLIENFVMANVPGNKAYTSEFGLYSSTVGSGFAIVIRAMDTILRSFKIS